MRLVLLHKGGFSLLNISGDVHELKVTHKIHKHFYPMNNDDSTVLYIWKNSFFFFNSVLKEIVYFLIICMLIKALFWYNRNSTGLPIPLHTLWCSNKIYGEPVPVFGQGAGGDIWESHGHWKVPESYLWGSKMAEGIPGEFVAQHCCPILDRMFFP